MRLGRGIGMVMVGAGLVGLVGCGVSVPRDGAAVGVEGITGRVHGGQQPITGATIQLYTVGTTGDGSASTPLLTSTVTTDANGNFAITGLYSCTSATQVYLVATGGNPGAGVNANVAQMTALGPCSNLTSGTFIFVNELTTVAGVAALAPYMTSFSAVGSGSSDAAALANAFTLAGEYVNTSTGATPGANVPSGYTVPTAELNTLADILATCVNSTGGVAGDSSLCGNLFSLTTPSGSPAPTDTIGAMLNLVNNPLQNTAGLFGMVSSSGPYQPTLTQTPATFLPALVPPPSTVQLQVTPSSLGFGSVGIGATASQTVYLENISSTSAVTISGITLGGASASEFSKTTTCGSSLAASTTSAVSSCAVTVTFAPTVTGSASAYLAVASSSSGSPEYVSLAGVGTAASGQPSAVLTGGGTLFDGFTSDLTLKNAGTGVLNISSISTITPYFSQTNDCGTALAAGASCTISVTNLLPIYGSGVGGSVSLPENLYGNTDDQITVSSNDPAGPSFLALSSIAPSVAAWPASILFPGTVVSSTSSTTITREYDYNSLTVSGTNASDFSLTGNTCGTSFNVYCTVTLNFTAGGAGVRTARLGYSNASYPTAVGNYIPVTGIGMAAAPSASGALTPSSLSFTYFSSPQAVTLYNYSTSSINIQSIGVTGGFSQTNNCGTVLYGQSLCTITVSSTQTLQGEVQGGLTVLDDLGTYVTSLSSYIGPILNFGDAEIGTKGVLTDNLVYPGLAETYNVFAFSSGAFSATGCTAAAHSGCTSVVSFSPTVVGATAVSFTPYPAQGYWDSSTPAYVLIGTGVGPGADLSFDASVVAILKLFNSGSTTIDLTGAGAFQMVGTNASYFTITTANQTPACGTLAPGSFCEVYLSMSGVSGALPGTIQVTDGTSGKIFTKAVMQRSNGVILPSITFPGATAVNSTSAAVAVTTQMTGAQFGSAVVMGDPADFTLTKSTCSTSENPCVLEAVFNPVRYNSGIDMTATVQITGNNHLVPPETVTLYGFASGLGYGTVSPTSVTYASRPAGSTSIPTTVTITNTGTATLTLSAPALSGTNAAEFSIQSTSCTGSLAVNASCTVGVSFAPVTAGYKTGSLVFAGSAGTNLPVSVALAGTAM